MQNEEVVKAVGAQAGSIAARTFSVLAKSRVGVCGLALTLAGFFGIFGVIGLTPQKGILSGYVFFFGVCLVGFASGVQAELLSKYFGFMFKPNGQLAFLLFAGNLAWSSWPFGFFAAAFTNFVAISSWYTANGDNLPSWLTGKPPADKHSSATGMVDVGRDELL